MSPEIFARHQQPAEAYYGRAHTVPDRTAHDLIIFNLCVAMDIRRVVELGTGPGNATRVFADVLELPSAWPVSINPMLVSIDIAHQPVANELAGREHVRFIIGDSAGCAAEAMRLIKRLDLVYCDSDHSYAHVLNELVTWAAYKPRLMLVDDTLDANEPHGSPLQAVIDFCRLSGWRWTNIVVGTGLAVLHPPRQIQHHAETERLREVYEIIGHTLARHGPPGDANAK